MNKNHPIEIVCHHTGGTDLNPFADSSNQTFEDVNAWHRQNPNVWLGYLSSLGYAIGYHYFIDKSGKVTQGRADTDEGAHTIGQNTQSIGICLAGNFDVTLPTLAQTESLRKLLIEKMAKYNIAADHIFPHRHFANKSCYGKNLKDDWALSLIPNAAADKIAKVKELLQEIQKLLE